jgi:glycosyltransferase involved in cell wall biosynthesis
VIIAIYKFIQHNNHPLAITSNFIYIERINSFFRQQHNLYGEKVDWHDFEYIEKEKARHGLPGENGQPVYVEANEEELNKKLFDENGYYGLISDKIALNRSVADYRNPHCSSIKYLKELPSVSIVIPFYNDHLSTLLRTVYSVINRAPSHLLKEVILVNDHSTKDFLYDELENYIKKHLKHIVKLLVLPKRSGLVSFLRTIVL